MKRSKQQISQFDLSPLARAGVLIMNNRDNELHEEHDIFSPHRDTHYILFIASSGQFRFMLDFTELQVNEAAMLLISPGQIHHIVEITAAEGWAIQFDPTLISESFRQILDYGFTAPIYEKDMPVLYQQVITICTLMYTLQTGEQDTYTARSTHELLGAVLSLIAGKLSPAQKQKESRSQEISQHFSRLLNEHYKTWKQPAQYAAELSISVAHLNDTVKNISGNSVSARIQDRSILEAKRLLYFTNLSVREIGYEAGYDNPVYFSKLFKKVTSLTPLEFRQQFRDQDNQSSL